MENITPKEIACDIHLKSTEEDQSNSHKTAMIDDWEAVKTVIQEHNIGYKIMDLYYKEEEEEGGYGFINKENIPKFQSSVTKEPIFVGFSDATKTPFMIIRFIDVNRNKKDGIPEGATSFLVITLCCIPHIGFEYFLEEINWINNPETGNYQLNVRHEMNLDGGTDITKYVVKLLQGNLENKKLK